MSTEKLPPCERQIYEQGEVVAVLSGGAIAIEGLVKDACRDGIKMDWHYFGGRAVILTLGNVKSARAALKRAMPIVLDGPL